MVNYQNSKIYKIVNSVNDMIYIGSTTRSLNQRMADHRRSILKPHGNIHRAMRDIGKENFKIILIENHPCNSKEELEKKEYEVINTFEKCKLYNSIFDGRPNEEVIIKIKNTVSQEEHKKMRSEMMKIIMSSPEAREKISRANKGRKASQETREKLSKIHKGRKKPQSMIDKITQFRFNFGCVSKEIAANRWAFTWLDEQRKRRKMSFPYSKYGGEANAKWAAEHYRYIVYPEAEMKLMLMPNYDDES